jgi:hypothetical protein
VDDDFCQSLGHSSFENREVVSLFISSWIALLADSPLNPEMKPFKLYKDFLYGISIKGLKGIVLEYSDLAHRLVSQHTIMGPDSSIGEWIADFKDTPVFFEYNRYFKTGDIHLLDFLYSFLNFGKKLDFVDESFNSVAFRDWMDIENKLADQTFEQSDIDALRRIMQIVLPPFSIDDFRPKFGPGAVQERGVKGRIGKLRKLQYDSLIDRFIFHGHIGMYGYGDDHGLSCSKVIPDPDSWTPASGVSSRIARLMFVPKNLKTARSICMEPNTLMFFQQGIEREMLRLIDSSPLSNFIDIRDQSRNRALSLAGSISGEIDTLDLSAASDRLSYSLMNKVFPNSWKIVMRVTRSHGCFLPDGLYHKLLKFAPMGSALCFPTQCILFTCVCIMAGCQYTYEVENADCDFLDWIDSNLSRVIGLFGQYTGYETSSYRPLAVYGDDICLDRRLTDKVKSILSRLGFLVNDTKSFTGSQAFRESCGGFYLAGHDITPLYFRIKDVKRKLTPSHVASHVHLTNQAFLKGYRNLYRFLRASIVTWECRGKHKNTASTINAIPYVSDLDRFGIMSLEPKNSHLESRENEFLQRTEIRVWTISNKYYVSDRDLIPIIDKYEYVRWWTGRSENISAEYPCSVSRTDTGGSGLRWRWIPSE